MNIVMNEAGRFIEVQGTAEGHAFTDDEFTAMLDLAKLGIERNYRRAERRARRLASRCQAARQDRHGQRQRRQTA